MKKISLWRILKKLKQVKSLIKAVIELIQYVETISVDPKLHGLITRIKLNLESITGKSIDDL
jgi:hypothetical protein